MKKMYSKEKERKENNKSNKKTKGHFKREWKEIQMT